MMYVVMQSKDHHTCSGGLANAFQRMDHRWPARSQWVDDDPSRGEQEATPHPISVYSKLNDCQGVQQVQGLLKVQI
jgi:hypothetical protein